MDDMYANLNNPAQSAAQIQQASQKPAWINDQMWQSMMQGNPSVMGHTQTVADPLATFQAQGSQQAQKSWLDNHRQYMGQVMAGTGSGFNGWYNDAEYNPTHNTLAQNAAAGPYVAGGNGMSGAPGGGSGGALGLPPPSPMQGGGGVPPMMSPGDPMQGMQSKVGMAGGGMGYRPPGAPTGLAQGMAQAGGGGFNEQTGQRMPMQAPRLLPQQAMMAQALRSRMRLR